MPNYSELDQALDKLREQARGQNIVFHATEREALFATHDELSSKAKVVMKSKNHDYASDSDPYKNFRTFGLLGILVRKSDKLARLIGFVEKGVLEVSDESIEDTIVDDINYSVIFEAMRRSMRHG